MLTVGPLAGASTPLWQPLCCWGFLPYYIQTPESPICFECLVLNSSEVPLLFFVHPPSWEAARQFLGFTPRSSQECDLLCSTILVSRNKTFTIVPLKSNTHTPLWCFSLFCRNCASISYSTGLVVRNSLGCFFFSGTCQFLPFSKDSFARCIILGLQHFKFYLFDYWLCVWWEICSESHSGSPVGDEFLLSLLFEILFVFEVYW